MVFGRGVAMNDVYVNYGPGPTPDWRPWPPAVQYGFICSGGWRIFSDPLDRISNDDRLWVYRSDCGYVGVGQMVEGAVPQRSKDFMVTAADGAMRSILDVLGPIANDTLYLSDPDLCEYFLRVHWIHTVDCGDAIGFGSEYFSNPQHCRCQPTRPQMASYSWITCE